MRFTAVILAAVLCVAVKATAAPAPVTNNEDKVSDEAIVQAAETLIKEDAPVTRESASAPEPEAAKAPAQAKESDIPVFLDAKKNAKSGDGVIWRLLASLVLVAGVGGALIFASRRWSRKKDKGGSKARIEMLHQFHLGPRKSLALIRVSGEVVLIGVTDHNVNMLKTVTLIDDELEGLMNKDFNNFLEDDFSIEDVRTALDSRA